MGISLYLAMTAAEISACDSQPDKLAYMACHFSPYSTGISNIPDTLPPDSILILNDRTPICGHDPKLIACQLSEAVERLQCSSLLLDFQRPDSKEAAVLSKYLTERLTCPVTVSALYANELNCPVLVPPCPLDQKLEDHLFPWRDRPVWLEIAANALVITVDKNKSQYTSSSASPELELPHTEPELLCHYRIETTDSAAVFTLSRTDADTEALIKKAETLGVCQCLGLWQELITKKLPVE